MKKLNSEFPNFQNSEILNKQQLRNILGGNVSEPPADGNSTCFLQCGCALIAIYCPAPPSQCVHNPDSVGCTVTGETINCLDVCPN